MNFCKPNLTVQCLLRVDTGIASAAASSPQPSAEAIADVINQQLATLFGLTASKVQIFSAVAPSPTLQLLPSFSSSSAGKRRPRRDNDDDVEGMTTVASAPPRGSDPAPASSVNKAAAAATAPPATATTTTATTTLSCMFVRAVLERRHVVQLRAACTAVTVLAKRAVRISVIGAPRKFVAPK